MQQRRQMMRALGLAGLLAAALPGCGFRLRAAPVFAFSSIHITPAPQADSLGAELQRQLRGVAGLELVDDAARAAQAQVWLELLSQQREKVVVALNAVGQVREFQLRLRVRFRLRTPQGAEWIAESEIAQQRDISFNETLVLAKASEENLLYRDMQADIAQQMLRRLAAARDVRAQPAR